MIETVDHNVANNTSIMDNIANEAGITRDVINILTEENSQAYDVSLPHDLSPDRRKEIESQINAKFITKIDTINLYSDTLEKGEPGYFMFRLDVANEIIAQRLSEVRREDLSTS